MEDTNYLKKEIYELIKTDETVFDFIQESSLDGLWYWDLENPEEEWMSPKFWTTLGYNPEEMPHKSSAWQDIIDQDDLKVATNNLHRHIEHPDHPYDQLVRYTHKNGSTVWIRCRGIAIRDEQGKAVRMLGVHNDVTEVNRTENVMGKWRSNVIDIVSRIVFFLGLPFVVGNSIYAVHNGRVDVVLIDSIILVVLSVIGFGRSISVALRSIILVSIPFIAGSYWLATSGLPGTGRIFLLFAVILGSLLFRRPGALTIWLLTITTIGFIYVAFAVGLLPLPTAIPTGLFDTATMVTSWFVESLIIMAGGTAILMGMERAEKSSIQAKQTAVKLWRLNSELEKRVRDQTEELQKQSDFLQRTQHAANIGSFHLDFGADRWESSETIDEILGIDSTYQRTIESWLRLVHPSDRDRVRSGLEAPALTAAGNYSIEYRIQRADTGETRWVHALGELTTNDNGEATGTYGTLQDITERKRAEAELEKFHRFVENSPVGIVITDTAGTIEYVNPGFTVMTGYEASEVLGQTLRVLKSGYHDDDFYRSMWQTLENGEVWRGEIHNKQKNDDTNWVLAVISPMQDVDGVVTHYISTMQDISDKKEMEHLRETFDHVMRHDLKNPLNAILNVPAILIELGGLSSDQIDLLRAVEESGQLMVSMIDSSLNMLKMERGSFEMRRDPIDLITILENVIQQNGVLIQRSNIDVSIVVDGRDLPADTRIQIFSDKTNLYTMISNLVVNAVEASSDHESVQLRVDTASPLAVSIVNQGTVPVAIREKFFEKFATFGKKKGTGLGTYSAKLIADTFGYSIDMNTSDETNQTTVTITMHGAEFEA